MQKIVPVPKLHLPVAQGMVWCYNKICACTLPLHPPLISSKPLSVIIPEWIDYHHYMPANQVCNPSSNNGFESSFVCKLWLANNIVCPVHQYQRSKISQIGLDMPVWHILKPLSIHLYSRQQQNNTLGGICFCLLSNFCQGIGEEGRAWWALLPPFPSSKLCGTGSWWISCV